VGELRAYGALFLGQWRSLASYRASFAVELATNILGAALDVVAVLVLFGATRLPALSKSLGQSVKIFRSEVKTDDDAKAERTANSEAAEPTKPADSPSAPTDKP